MTDAKAGKVPHVLVIMDGVGHREAVEDNAFSSKNPKSYSDASTSPA